MVKVLSFKILSRPEFILIIAMKCLHKESGRFFPPDGFFFFLLCCWVFIAERAFL